MNDSTSDILTFDEPEDPTPPEVEIPSDDLGPRLGDLVAAVDAVHRDVRALDQHASIQERIIDRLHADNERLRAGERLMILRPLLTDLQRLRGDLLHQAATLPADMTAAQMTALLESFAYSAEQALERGGVSVLRPEIGAPFDAGRHRAAGVLPAPRPDLDGTVAHVLSDGYVDTTADRTLAAAVVRVHRWSPPEPADDGAGVGIPG